MAIGKPIKFEDSSSKFHLTRCLRTLRVRRALVRVTQSGNYEYKQRLHGHLFWDTLNKLPFTDIGVEGQKKLKTRAALQGAASLSTQDFWS